MAGFQKQKASYGFLEQKSSSVTLKQFFSKENISVSAVVSDTQCIYRLGINVFYKQKKALDNDGVFFPFLSYTVILLQQNLLLLRT